MSKLVKSIIREFKLELTKIKQLNNKHPNDTNLLARLGIKQISLEHQIKELENLVIIDENITKKLTSEEIKLLNNARACGNIFYISTPKDEKETK